MAITRCGDVGASAAVGTFVDGRHCARTRSVRAFASLTMAWCLICAAVAATIHHVESFQTTTITRTRHFGNICTISRKERPLYLFGRNKEDKKSHTSSSSINESEDGDREKKRSKIPFFGRLRRSKEEKNDDALQPQEQTQEEPKQPIAVAVKATEPLSPAGVSELRPPQPKRKKDAPSADDLKLMAERARLEAERMDAELTLAKIDKLEKLLVRSKKDDESGTTVNVEDLQYELDALQAKLKGEPVPPKKTDSPAKNDASSAATASSSSSSATKSASDKDSEKEPTSVSIKLPVGQKPTPRTGAIADVDDARVLEAAAVIAESEPDFFSQIRSVEELDMIPEFLLKVIAPFYGLKGDKVDRKELLRRVNMSKELDYSFLAEELDPPSFDRSDIRRKKAEIVQCDKTNLKNGQSEVAKKSMDWLMEDSVVTVTKTMVEKADGNATQLALYCLEYDYYLFSSMDNVFKGGDGDMINNLFQNATYFGSMYPKCVVDRGENKGDDYVSEEPTEAQMDVLTKTILPAIKFSSSSKPQKVPGGYAITGTHKFENGDLLIEAIDNEIAKSRPNLKDQVTVLYTPSYGPIDEDFGAGMENLANMDMNQIMGDPDVLEMFAETEPILYITGPNIVRDANPFGLVFTSILGLATSWYLSVYPFLLNEKIANRIESDLQLIELNQQPDLSYLTDLTVPLFLSFLGIQLVHEAAHRVTAIAKGVKLSVPVFVPSLITGITSTVTTFKTLPKNKNDMFDISAAGPLAGIVVSSIALAIGAELTQVSDPATLPALPLDILRQSTLGAGIIDNVIPGSLYVPEGAPSTGITIPLHPFAVAGYVGLLVNALALLPIGSK